MKKLAEYKAKTLAVSDVHKNPTRDDIMQKKPLYCTSENPKEHSAESLSIEEYSQQKESSVENIGAKNAKEGMEIYSNII